MSEMRIKYNICVASELAAGLRGFNDTVTVIVESGDPCGEKGEFAEYMRHALHVWYDGGIVMEVK